MIARVNATAFPSWRIATGQDLAESTLIAVQCTITVPSLPCAMRCDDATVQRRRGADATVLRRRCDALMQLYCAAMSAIITAGITVTATAASQALPPNPMQRGAVISVPNLISCRDDQIPLQPNISNNTSQNPTCHSNPEYQYQHAVETDSPAHQPHAPSPLHSTLHVPTQPTPSFAQTHGSGLAGGLI
ncbi:hypothetical protein V493_02169 [Pseudogymnoascus sp. VKM F-4281 (FW-2241)]|nr:hypothetical protein V493_02169 [Pseudogymnoascus sp. VKM F-4281 (FW-2241)]